MKPKIIVIIVVVTAAIAVFAYFRLTAVGPANTIHVSGNIEANEIRLSFRVPGRISELPGQASNLTLGFSRHPLRKYLSFNFAPIITAHIARNVQIIIKQPNSILSPPNNDYNIHQANTQ